MAATHEDHDRLCRLLLLPSELRNLIYDLVFEGRAPRVVLGSQIKQWKPCPAITATCASIRSETLLLHQQALYTFWQQHTLEFVAGPEILEQAARDELVAQWKTLHAPGLQQLNIRMEGFTKGLFDALTVKLSVGEQAPIKWYSCLDPEDDGQQWLESPFDAAQIILDELQWNGSALRTEDNAQGHSLHVGKCTEFVCLWMRQEHRLRVLRSGWGRSHGDG